MPKRTDIKSIMIEDQAPSPLAGEGWGGGYANVVALIAHGGLWRWPRPSQNVFERIPRRRRNISGNICAESGWMVSDFGAKCRWAHTSSILPVSPRGLLSRSMADNTRRDAMKTRFERSRSKDTGIASCGFGTMTSLQTRTASWKRFEQRSVRTTEQFPPSLTLPRQGGGKFCASRSLAV